jgi:hypothetical protein
MSYPFLLGLASLWLIFTVVGLVTAFRERAAVKNKGVA